MQFLPTTREREKLRIQLDSWLGESRKSNGAREIPEIGGAIGTEIGLVRRENQDRAVIAQFSTKGEPPFIVAILCDGIGGSANGGQSADIAVREVLYHLALETETRPDTRLLNATIQANRRVHTLFEGKSGTTIVAMLFSRGSIFAVSAGDSRIYKQSGRELVQVSLDDTIAGELSRLRGADSAQKLTDQFSTALAQFVGVGRDFEPRKYNFDPDAPDRFVMSSDGLSQWPTSALSTLLANAHNPETFVSRCLALSRWSGGQDNATVICVDPSRARDLGRQKKLTPSIRLWDAFGRVDIFDEYDPPIWIHRAITSDSLVELPASKPEKKKSKKKAKSDMKSEIGTSENSGIVQRKLQIEISPTPTVDTSNSESGVTQLKEPNQV